MRVIDIKKENINLVIRNSEEILFKILCVDIVTNISVKIEAKESDIDLLMYFIDSKKTCSKISILTKIPEESTNNNVNIKLNALIISPKSSIELSPSFELYNNSSVVEHSTIIGTINDKWKRYLYSRGLDKEDINELFINSYTK